MKKVLSLLAAFAFIGSLSAQTLLEEGFNSGIPAGWTMYSDGNTPAENLLGSGFTADTAWTWFDGSEENFTGNPGGFIASTSWFSPAGTANRWIITPGIALTDSGFMFSVDCMSQDPNYPDGFKVMIGTNANDTTSFTEVLSRPHAGINPNFANYTVNLNAYVGQTIYVALVNNSEDRFILLADNFKVFRLTTAHGATLQRVATQAYAAINDTIPIYATVKGEGYEPITSFKAKYIVDGTDTSAEMDVTGLNIAYNTTGSFKLPLMPRIATTGSHSFSVLLYAPNGVDSTVAGSGNFSSSTIVYNPADTVKRTTVLEQFTGSQCGWCPGGHDRIAQALRNHPNVIWMAHHAGFNQDALSNANSTALTWFFNDPQGTFAPAYMIDRTRMVASYPGPVIGVSSDINYIDATISYGESVPCFVSINTSGVSYDMSTRKVSGNITGNFKTAVYGANTRINVYVVEDTLYMDQTDYSTGSTRTIKDYMHNNTCRGAITGNWGEAITPASDGSFSYAVDYTLPEKHKSWRTRLVVLVSNYDASDANNSVVLNAAKTANFPGTYVGINEVSANVALSVYPNPAADYVNVEANENIRSIRVVNTLGQTVYSNGNVNNENVKLNTANYANGIYVITVATDNGTSIKRISINR